MIIIDAKDKVLGRLCTVAAKHALLGEEVIVVNSEKALVAGNPKKIIEENLDKLKIKNKGNYRLGPFHQKSPDRFVRKTIRGMLPYKKTRGRRAYKNVKCFIGVPKKKLTELNVNVEKISYLDTPNAVKPLRRRVSVGEICKSIGGSYD
ncbi:MAG: 50S ribosomal protein L13 [Candidatus Altiarchaeales archaeon]|nr:50S ribosomal protein L13 [Candidatus Altiarchaeales archaeon]